MAYFAAPQASPDPTRQSRRVAPAAPAPVRSRDGGTAEAWRRIAFRAVPTSRLHRQCASCRTLPAEARLAGRVLRRCPACERALAAGEGPPAGCTCAAGRTAGLVAQAVGTGGRPLDPQTSAFFGARFGRAFGDVRVHTGEAADRSARAVDARAYTVGNDVVFRAGTYAPGTQAGRRLLAHELAHVAQQDGAGARRLATAPALEVGRADDPLEREADRMADRVLADGPGLTVASLPQRMATDPLLRRAPSGAPKKATPPRLDVRKSADVPCACLVFIHNEERNARRTAELMHKHCAYNLAIITPDRPGQREIPIGSTTKDPNELFPPAIARACRQDRKTCEADVAASAAKPTLDSTQKQFFLAIDDCSEGFALPVVALHNNSIDDTRAFHEKRKQLAAEKKDPFADLPRDIDKRPQKPEPGEKAVDPVAKMKEALKKHFKLGPLTNTPRKTNIFRWCASDDLSRCHIGDPDNPDNVVWVTNEKDFETLSATDVNVVLQAAAAKGGESETDLSTLFLTVQGLIAEEGAGRILEIWKSLDFGDLTWDAFWAAVGESMRQADVTTAAMEEVRYINIETPSASHDPKMKAGAHRVEQYQAIVYTLKALGLHCCAKDPEGGEAAIENELA